MVGLDLAPGFSLSVRAIRGSIAGDPVPVEALAGAGSRSKKLVFRRRHGFGRVVVDRRRGADG